MHGANCPRSCANGWKTSSGRSEATDLFLEALSSQPASVREMTAWAMAISGDKRSVLALSLAVAGDEDPQVRQRSAWALGILRDSAAVDALVKGLSDSDSDVQSMSAWSLGILGESEAVSALKSIEEQSDSPEVRERVRWAIEMIQ